MHRIFVYGSLLEGEPNHRVLGGARLVRRARTAPAYTLVSLGAFPALIEGGTTRVVGEVYEVDDATLAALDRLEGVPRFYVRLPVRLERGAPVDAYVLPAERVVGRNAIPGGDWRGYQRTPRAPGGLRGVDLPVRVRGCADAKLGRR